jgi:excisionase family DNA binding protein
MPIVGIIVADELLDPDGLAKYLGIPLNTVYQMNSRGTAPRRIRVGKHIRYRRTDVDAWLESRAVGPGPAA